MVRIEFIEVKISKIGPDQPELVTIFCHKVDDRIKDIADFVKSRQGQLSGTLDGKEYEVQITEVYYIESVDDRCFLYCESKVYEAKQRLGELTAKRAAKIAG